MSVYKDDLTKDGLAKAMARLLKAFPKFDKNQIEVLKDRIKENKFTDQRIWDAVNNVIDTYEGWDKLPNLANILSYDKRTGVLTYIEVLEQVNNGKSMDKFVCFDKENKLWIEKIKSI